LALFNAIPTKAFCSESPGQIVTKSPLIGTFDLQMKSIFGDILKYKFAFDEK